jgi:glycosyltransferase involved in cell wall biosynthesis
MDPPEHDLRVLYVIDSLARGGAERSLATLAPHYRDLGVELCVVVLVDRDGLEAEVRAAGATVLSVAHARNRATQVRELRSVILDRRPHLVHTTLFEADVIGRIAARAAQTPVVSSIVNEAYGSEHAAESGVSTSKLRLAQALDATTARLAVRMHAVSHRVAQVMSGRLHYPPARIDVIPRGRDPDVIGSRTGERRAGARSMLGLRDEQTAVLAVGRLEPQKAFDVLISAFRSVSDVLPDAHLLIAGREGNASDKVRSAINASSLGGRVTLLGERGDVADLLCAADVFASASRREGMPGAVIEAMALEAPIVATELPQVREVTGDDAAILVPVDDSEAFAEGIVRCARERDAAGRMASIGRRRFLERFTVDQTAREMVAFYGRALSSDDSR